MPPDADWMLGRSIVLFCFVFVCFSKICFLLVWSLSDVLPDFV